MLLLQGNEDPSGDHRKHSQQTPEANGATPAGAHAVAHGRNHHGGKERHGSERRGVNRSVGGDFRWEMRFDERRHKDVGDGDAGQGDNGEDEESGTAPHKDADDQPQAESNHGDQHGGVEAEGAGGQGGDESDEGEDEGGEAGEEAGQRVRHVQAALDFLEDGGDAGDAGAHVEREEDYGGHEEYVQVRLFHPSTLRCSLVCAVIPVPPYFGATLYLW